MCLSVLLTCFSIAVCCLFEQIYDDDDDHHHGVMSPETLMTIDFHTSRLCFYFSTSIDITWSGKKTQVLPSELLGVQIRLSMCSVNSLIHNCRLFANFDLLPKSHNRDQTCRKRRNKREAVSTINTVQTTHSADNEETFTTTILILIVVRTRVCALDGVAHDVAV